MPGIEDVVRYEICEHSNRIRDLKKECFKTEKALKWGYFKEGNPVIVAGNLSWEDRQKEGISLKEYEFDRVVEFINPRHPRWKEYKALKREVSIWLATRRIQKTGDSATAKDHGCSGIAAQKRLARTLKKLQKNPKDFQHVDAWVKTKEVTNV